MLTVLLQGLFCGVLQVIVQKLSERESFKAGILQFADQIMEVLLQVTATLTTRCSCVLSPLHALQVCQRYNCVSQVFACRGATVHEEALLAVGSVTYASGKQFIKYMERFSPILVQGLTNHQVRDQTLLL